MRSTKFSSAIRIFTLVFAVVGLATLVIIDSPTESDQTSSIDYSLVSQLSAGVANAKPEQPARKSKSPTTVRRDSAKQTNNTKSIKKISQPAPVLSCKATSIIKPAALVLNSDGLNQSVETPRYYRVYGRTIKQIRQQLTQCGPDGYFASTNYNMNWSYKTVHLQNGQCSVRDVRVGMHIIVQYPSWQADQYTPKSVTIAWSKMMRNLKNHEQGHVNRSISYSRNMSSAINAIGEMPCSQINSSVQATINNYIKLLKSSNSSYDQTTNHGATQGAVL